MLRSLAIFYFIRITDLLVNEFEVLSVITMFIIVVQFKRMNNNKMNTKYMYVHVLKTMISYPEIEFPIKTNKQKRSNIGVVRRRRASAGKQIVKTTDVG